MFAKYQPANMVPKPSIANTLLLGLLSGTGTARQADTAASLIIILTSCYTALYPWMGNKVHCW